MKATGMCSRKGRDPDGALGEAFNQALGNLEEQLGREANFDDLNFHGGFTTTDVVLEIWEE